MTTVEAQLGEWVHRPLVEIDPDVMPFWDGLKSHEFRLCRCSRCGSWWYPFTVCREHEDIPELTEMEWVASSGRGTIFAKVVVEQVTDQAYAAEVPFALTIITLEEGPLFPARLVDCDARGVEIGTEVEVVYFDSAEAGHTLPFFRPAR